MQNSNQSNITGTAINYLYICTRKLWFYQNHLEMEHTSEYVDLGQLLHEDSYPREKRREWNIGERIQIDFVTNKVFSMTSNPGQLWKQHILCSFVITFICSNRRVCPTARVLSTIHANDGRQKSNSHPKGNRNWKPLLKK